jgi:hypothetical protein
MLDNARKRLALALHVLRTGQAPSRTRSRIPAITPQEVAEAKRFFPMEKFFIFGHARSGTTLLARLVRLHPEVHCNYQAHFFTRPPLLQALVADEQVESWLTRRSNRWNHGGDLSAVVLRAAADFILESDACQAGKNIVGDKSPNSLNDGESVRLMHKVYPDGRLIYIIRDGRDTVLSHRFQAFIDSPQHLSKEDLRIRDEFSHDPEPFLKGERSIFTEKGIRRAAEGWVRNVVETDMAGKELYGEKHFTVRYEDLLVQPVEEMSRVWAFLKADPLQPGLEAAVEAEIHENPDADWQQQKAGEIARPLLKGRHGSWREMFTARDRQVFHAVAADTLNAWGYEAE